MSNVGHVLSCSSSTLNSVSLFKLVKIWQPFSKCVYLNIKHLENTSVYRLIIGPREIRLSLNTTLAVRCFFKQFNVCKVR